MKKILLIISVVIAGAFIFTMCSEDEEDPVCAACSLKKYNKNDSLLEVVESGEYCDEKLDAINRGVKDIWPGDSSYTIWECTDL
jgi:hypothetical protein